MYKKLEKSRCPKASKQKVRKPTPSKKSKGLATNTRKIGLTKKKGKNLKPKDYLSMVIDIYNKEKKEICHLKKVAEVKPYEKKQPLNNMKMPGFKRFKQQPIKVQNHPKSAGIKKQRAYGNEIQNKMTIDETTLLKLEIQNSQEDLIPISRQISSGQQFQCHYNAEQLLEPIRIDPESDFSFDLNEADQFQMRTNQEFYFEDSQSSSFSSVNSFRARISDLREDEGIYPTQTDFVLEENSHIDITLFNSSSESQFDLLSEELDLQFPRFSAKTIHEEKQCSICLENYEKAEQLRELPCAHIFHKECIDHWIKKNFVCPFCRRSL